MRLAGVGEEDLVVVLCGRILTVVDAGVVDDLGVRAVGDADARAAVPEADIVDERGPSAVLVQDEAAAVGVVARDVEVFEGDGLLDEVRARAALDRKQIDAARPGRQRITFVGDDALLDMNAPGTIVRNAVDAVPVGDAVDVLEVTVGRLLGILGVLPSVLNSPRRAARSPDLRFAAAGVG